MTNPHGDTTHELLCSELAALQVYHQALEWWRESGNEAELRQLRADHWDAVQALRKYLRCPEPLASSAARHWYELTQTADSDSGLNMTLQEQFRHRVLEALKQGEELGTQSYEDALHDDLLPVECQTLVRTKLLPLSQLHVSVLDRMLHQDLEE